ncbi:MAG: zinc-binding dehydrogenase [Alphaproteobacteria bacterium]|nr:zinc-binding dehydrogenase [Alphaproteobacteria bacterium]
MRSYQLTRWGHDLEAREVPTPAPKGAEVLVRITACGLCHSDLHLRQGYFDWGGGRRVTLEERGMRLPLTLGHEIVGAVAALGADAAGVRVGDARVVFPWIGCGACDLCQRDELLCRKPRHLGARTDGGYAEYVLVPHARYLFDYGRVPMALACTYACSGLTAYHALKKVGSLRGDDCLVLIGAGGVGLSGLLIAPSVTPARVIVADKDPKKRQVALESGAHAVIDNTLPGAIQRIQELTAGGAAAAIDFVGAPATTEFGLGALRRGGTHVIVGLYGSSIDLPLPMLPHRLLDVRGANVGTLTEMQELMALVRAGRVPPMPVTTRPMAQVNAALADLEAGKVVGRCVLTP